MSIERSTLHARRWWALAVFSLVQLMVFVEATMFVVAEPSAQRALLFVPAGGEWLLSVYVLAFSSLVLLGGRLSDRWGSRLALYVGLVGFAAASVLGAAAQSFTMLLCAIAIQGVFSALLAPAALSALSTTFSDPSERAKAFAVYGVIAGSAVPIGLMLSGALLRWASWRWCFLIDVPLAAVALVGVAMFVQGDQKERAIRLDVLDALLAGGGIFLLFYGLSHAVFTIWPIYLTFDWIIGATTSWLHYSIWGSLVVGVSLLTLFGVRQRRSSDPLLAGHHWMNRTTAGSLLGLFVASAGVPVTFVFLTDHLVQTGNYSPLHAGVLFLPLVLGVVLSALFASARLLAKTGPRPLIPTGMLLSMMGTVLFTRITIWTDYWDHVMPGLVLVGLGLGLIIAPAVATAMPRRDAGAVSATVNLTQLLGAVLGAAVLSSIGASVALRAVIYSKGSTSVAQVTGLQHAYTVVYWSAAGLFGLGALATFFLLSSGVPMSDGELASSP
jgi:MFS family permease